MHTSTGTSSAAGALKLCTKVREQIEGKIKDVTGDSEKDYKFQVFELKVTMRLADAAAARAGAFAAVAAPAAAVVVVVRRHVLCCRLGSPEV